jgi:hypothetical protein
MPRKDYSARGKGILTRVSRGREFDRYVSLQRRGKKTIPVELDIQLDFQFSVWKASFATSEAHGWLKGFDDFRVLELRQAFARATLERSFDHLRGPAAVEVIVRQGQLRQLILYKLKEDEKPRAKMTGRVIEVSRGESVARYVTKGAELTGFRYGSMVKIVRDEVAKTPIALLIETERLDP